ncbi:oligosaccharide flippase family protein [Pedobacter sp. SD-b]|uniref:Oligosaccharide flippase family protein n=1 Tax=Pedobacter segetis TaxID=2793069 RepID=A0ABS1BMI6_9SPHI|nr:oligosaccharide flippase family protein [Pedobacter segetis]MBK0384105.1 oligosaccharide flippase family protein [Pedobacter segetis]
MVAKKFAAQVSLLIVVNLIVKLVWIFLIERKIQLLVGFQNYGLYYGLFNFTLILSIINDPGLSNYLIKSVASKRPNSKQIADLFSIKIMLSCAYLILSLALSFFMGYQNAQLIFILVAYQILWSFLIYLRGFLKGHQFLNTEVLFSIVDKLLLIFTLIPLFYLPNPIIWTINRYAFCQFLAVLVSIALCGVFLGKNRITVLNRINLKPGLSVLKELFPFAIFAFLVLAYSKIDVVMLQKLLPDKTLAIGNYAAAYRFLDASNMLPILFASLFYPVISKHIKEKKYVGASVKPSLAFLMSMALVISFASWFFKQNLMQLFYGQSSSEELVQIFGVLMFSGPLVVVYYLYGTVLTANNNLKILNITSAFGLVINIGLNLWLIPNFEALGAAISTFITFLIIGIAEIFFYYRLFKHQNHFMIWFKITLFAVLLLFIGNGVIYLSKNWIINLGAFVTMSIIVASLLKLLDLKMIKTMIYKG